MHGAIAGKLDIVCINDGGIGLFGLHCNSTLHCLIILVSESWCSAVPQLSACGLPGHLETLVFHLGPFSSYSKRRRF